jgi:hypothetical protein
MKIPMKTSGKLMALLILIAGLSLQSCKKDEKDPTLDSNFRTFNEDSQYLNGEIDQADNDINNALSDIPAFGRLSSEAGVLSSPLCGATIDSSQIAQKILYFNFDGVTPCFSPSRTRHGQIKVQLTSGTYWSDVNAVLTVTYINFKVVRLYDNKSITLNGVKTVKNVNGNNWIGFFTGSTSLKYQSRAFNINVLFNNGATALWNVARLTQWTYTPSGSGPNSPRINFTANGDTTLNGFSNVDAWGLNRFAQNFTTYYTVPLVSNTYCGLWRPNSGSLTHSVSNSVFELVLGVDQSGNPTPYACAYGYKVTWQVNGNTYVKILSY